MAVCLSFLHCEVSWQPEFYKCFASVAQVGCFTAQPILTLVPAVKVTLSGGMHNTVSDCGDDVMSDRIKMMS
jgi:hypothetical protein